MKWTTLLLCLLALPACTYVNTRVIENPQVIVTPAYSDISIVDEQPVDVTDTVVSYY